MLWLRRGTRSAVPRKGERPLSASLQRAEKDPVQALASLGADPHQVAALVELGFASARQGDPQRAAGLLRRALQLEPNHPKALALQGALLAREAATRGRGIATLRHAAALDPADPSTWTALADAQAQAGHRAEASEARLQAVRLQPGNADALFDLGLALQGEGRHVDALERFDEALRLDPQHLPARFGRATALHAGGFPDQAEPAYRAILAQHPDHAESWSNLGRIERDRGRVEEAVGCYDQAVRIAPGFADAHWNRAIALFLLGRMEEAWEEHEWRWQVPGFPSVVRGFAQPLWQGEALRGRTLLLHAEQGLGDTLQFLRYVRLAAERAGGRIVLEVQAPLLRLARSVPGVDVLLRAGDPLPAFDLHAPLLSLPRALGPKLEDIPGDVPYLAVEAEEVARFARLLEGPGPVVGFVWAGSPTHGNDANRSIAVERIARLAEIPGVRAVSLQLGPQAGRLGGALDLAPHLTDFASTAAALARLDLLVTVDTSVAHLAGALGRPVSVLLPFAPDWRWMQTRTDSPWYPTMSLHRQERPRDWARPLAELEASITALTRKAQAA